MSVWFPKRLETFTGEGLALKVSETGSNPAILASRLLFLLTFASVTSITFSIAVSQIFLGAANVCWLYLLVRHRGWMDRPIVPLYFAAAFAVATGVSAVLSSQPLYSFGYFKKFWIFSLLLIIPTAFRRAQDIEGLYCCVGAGATLSATLGIFQYFLDPKISLVNRITGLTGHWMTFSGLQMLSLLAVISLLLSGRSSYRWLYPAVFMQAFALALSQTRSAWLGFLVGLFVLACLLNRRWVLMVLSISLGSYLVLPQHFQERVLSSFDFSDLTTRIRLELVHTGWNMIKAHPFFGVGPRMVPLEYRQYNTTNEFPSWIYQHLHNNFIQIAAELGLVALLAWICILSAFLVHSFRHLTAGAIVERKFAARAAVASLVALLVAGMFEYNFGDSEVLTLFLFIAASPYVLFREASSRAPAQNHPQEQRR